MTLSFLQKVRYLVFMEFIPTEEISVWISDMLDFESEDDDQCEEESCENLDTSRRLLDDTAADATTHEKKKSNFGKSSLVQNMGIVFIAALVIVIFLVLLLLVKYLVRNNQKCHAVYLKISNAVFYNLFIRYVL